MCAVADAFSACAGAMNMTTELFLRMALAAEALADCEKNDQTITHGELAQRIGLWRRADDGRFPSWSMKNILNAMSASQRRCGVEQSPFHRVVNERTGEPGQGLHATSRIVTSRSRTTTA
jgi:hypothetical protein